MPKLHAIGFSHFNLTHHFLRMIRLIVSTSIRLLSEDSSLAELGYSVNNISG